MPFKNNTRGTKIQAAERQRQAVQLRLAGLTYEAIGEKLGITAPACYQLVKKHMDKVEAETAESIVELKRIELERFDAMLAGIWEKAQSGDTFAIAQAIKISEQRRKLLGLDAAIKTELTGANGEALGAFAVPTTVALTDWATAAKTASQGEEEAASKILGK